MADLCALVLLSGGVDSAACARFLKDQRMDVSGLFIDFGQAAVLEECQAAARIANWLDVPLSTVAVGLNTAFSTGEVIGRNAALAFVSLMKFPRRAKGCVAQGLHAGSPYFDCSAGFVEQINRLFLEYSNGSVSFAAPFVDWDKGAVYEYSRQIELPFHMTYSCEEGGPTPCGKCRSCQDRARL